MMPVASNAPKMQKRTACGWVASIGLPSPSSADLPWHQPLAINARAFVKMAIVVSFVIVLVPFVVVRSCGS